MVRSLARALLALCLVATATGCGSYVERSSLVRHDMLSGDWSGALERLGDTPPGEDVLADLQVGLVQLDAGRYEAAAQRFDAASLRIEELYTKSLSREAFAFLSNDATLPYTGYPHEQVWLHVYAALARRAAGDHEGALVEMRRADLRLAQMQELRGEERKGYSRDPLAEWLAAWMYLDAGEGEAALVSLRRAEAAYAEADSVLGLRRPIELVADHIEIARRLGSRDEADTLASRHRAAASLADERAAARGDSSGTVLVLYEAGFVDHIVENRLDYPVLEGEDVAADDDYARRVYRRGGRGQYRAPQGVKIAYWLSLALPAMESTPTALPGARVVAGDHEAPTTLAHDLSAVARLTFEEQQGKRIVRSLVRALTKYLATREVKQENELLGWFVNAATSLSERADTRSWSTLPDIVRLGRLDLPAGRHDVELELLDERGQLVRTATFEGVPVRAGGVTFLRYRGYR